MRAAMRGLAQHARAFAAGGWRILHVVITLVPFGFGVVLAQPGATFSISPAYAVMASLMSEPAWAVASFGAASVGYIGLTSREWQTRMKAGIVLAVWHGTVSICAVLSTGLSTGSTTYAALMVGAYAIVWHAVAVKVASPDAHDA